MNGEQRERELAGALVAVVGILRERAIDDGLELGRGSPARSVRSDAVRLVEDRRVMSGTNSVGR